MVTLTLVLEGNPSVSWVIPKGVSPRFGRDPVANDVILHDPTVSRSHARLEARGGDWFVIDGGSRKGTFVNGSRVDGEKTIRSGDVLEIGPYVLLLDLEAEALPQSIPGSAERTQRLELERCPRCGALALDFQNCMRCGAPLSSPS